MENPLITGFNEKQHEEKLGRGAAKRLEGQASPSDCRKTAKKNSEEDFL
jgi:hypothetical protein